MPDPVQLSSSTASSPLSPALRNTLYSALLSNGGIPAIQSSLTHELQASGWTTNLRAYITALLRSGECTSFNEVLDRVLAEATLGPSPSTSSADSEKKETNGVNGVNGHKVNGTGSAVAALEGKSVEEGGIAIPERAIVQGVRAVRRELEAVVEITVEDDDE
jgi:hypothetical protein